MGALGRGDGGTPWEGRRHALVGKSSVTAALFLLPFGSE